jgi:hypothetical protein
MVGGNRIDPVKTRVSITARRILFFFLFITSLKSNLCTALTTQNTTKNNCINSHAQNTTALEFYLFLTRIHRLLVTNKTLSPFPSANCCQSELQTPQSLSIASDVWKEDTLHVFVELYSIGCFITRLLAGLSNQADSSKNLINILKRNVLIKVYKFSSCLTKNHTTSLQTTNGQRCPGK